MHVHYPEWTMYKRGDYHLKTLNSTDVGFLRHLRRRGHDAHPERAYMAPKKQKIDELERSNNFLTKVNVFMRNAKVY